MAEIYINTIEVTIILLYTIFVHEIPKNTNTEVRMLKENKNFIIKMFLSFAFLLCLSSVSAYASDVSVDYQKTPDINSAITGKQVQGTIVNAEGSKNLSESAYSSSLAASRTSSNYLSLPGDFDSIGGTWKTYFDDTRTTPEFKWDYITYNGKTRPSISITGNNVSGSVVVSKVSIEPGNIYNFSAFVKGLNATTSGAISIYIAQCDKNDKLIEGTDTICSKDGTFDWQKVDTNIVADPNASSLCIKLTLDGSGTVWFDDISLINKGAIPGPLYKAVVKPWIKKTTYIGFKVTLDGSKSLAKDGVFLTYNWCFESQPVGSTSTLSSADTVNPYFIPDIAGDYNLLLTVKDDLGNIDTKKVTVRAKKFSDISDDDNFNSMNKLKQKILSGYTFKDFIPLCDGWIIIGDTTKNQIIILNTLTAEIAKIYQLNASPINIDFNFEKGIIVATQSTTDNIAKIDVNTDNISYITATSNTIMGGNSDVVFGRYDNVFFLRNERDSWIGILDISRNTEIGYKNIYGENLAFMAFNKSDNNLIIGESGMVPSSLQIYAYDEQNHTLSLSQKIPKMGGNGEHLAISNDDKHIAFCCGGGNGAEYSIFDINSSNLSKNFGEWYTGPYPVAAAFSYDNKYILATNTYVVKLFDVDKHTLVRTVDLNLRIDIDNVGISRGGKIGYAYTEQGEFYSFRIDGSSLMPLDITGISTDKKTPQLEDTDITVAASTSGGVDDNLYHFMVYDGKSRILEQSYSTRSTFDWNPEALGEYYLVIEAKDTESANSYDAYNVIKYTIKSAPAAITVSGPSDCIITTGASITLKYSACVKDRHGNILSDEKVKWAVEGQVAGVVIDDSTGVVTIDGNAKPGSFNIIAKAGDVSGTITLTAVSISSIEINGTDEFEIPLTGSAISKYTAVVKNQSGNPMPDQLVTWDVYDSSHKPVSTLKISSDGVLTIDSKAKPDTYIIEARSVTDSYVYSTMSILLTAPAPALTGLSWEKGSSYGTTKATTLPGGTLKYVVGAANMLSHPKVGKTETAYTNMLTANEDIPITAGQHIFIVSVDNNGKVTGWADVAVDTENIRAGSAMGDLNDDGAVNAFDFALMKMYLLGKTTDINKMNSDMNMDGEINALDFALLKKQLLK